MKTIVLPSHRSRILPLLARRTVFPLLLIGASIASAQNTVPKSWDFGTDPGKDNLDDFTVITSGTVSLTADNVQFQSSDRQNRGIRTEVSDLALANKQDFTMQATLGTSFNNVFQRFVAVEGLTPILT
ncbi:MAG: hypothetical protein WD708_02150 [Kiritimatiellia bacterium]